MITEKKGGLEVPCLTAKEWDTGTNRETAEVFLETLFTIYISGSFPLESLDHWIETAAAPKEEFLWMKVDRVTANHSLSSTAIQQKFQHSLSLLS